ncbi:hypothetical protein CPB83DRAFT_849700 [Crepidotus variabilis]|uniref:Uncharacterized protein n=1 Tax=Crepidotus variabilis TaxID=179855 RepID=A0A9P6JSY8_9AGAR|nr:hypothetical protein CPB83DRAFT_849700 [Crepidotus variabilis]
MSPHSPSPGGINHPQLKIPEDNPDLVQASIYVHLTLFNVESLIGGVVALAEDRSITEERRLMIAQLSRMWGEFKVTYSSASALLLAWRHVEQFRRLTMELREALEGSLVELDCLVQHKIDVLRDDYKNPTATGSVLPTGPSFFQDAQNVQILGGSFIGTNVQIIQKSNSEEWKHIRTILYVQTGVLFCLTGHM